jgi:hypothetical protein
MYRPRLMVLEGRVVPGTVLTKLDTSGLLGSALAGLGRSDLDLISAEAIAVAAGEAPQAPASIGQPLTGSGLGELAAPIVNPLPDLAGPLGAIQQPAPLGGINLAGGDLVNMGFLDGSSIAVGTNMPQFSVNFGSDPPTDGWDNVFVDLAGNVSGAQSDFHIGAATVSAGGFHFNFQLLAESDLSGTYDRATGNALFQVMMDSQVTSPDAPGFDNSHCFIGLYPDGMHEAPVPINLSTDPTQGGTPFSMDSQSRENGVVVDNTFAVDAIPDDPSGQNPTCGGNSVIRWAQLIDGLLGLPAPSGVNNLTLHVALDQPIGP